MRLPAVVVNFKAYPEALGGRGLDLARICAAVAEETGAGIAVAPPLASLALLAREVRLPVFAQHADDADAGSVTGWTPVEAVLEAGAVGTLVNHSEHKVARRKVRGVVERCRDVGLETIVCADDVAEAAALAKYGPDFVAVEPPELIGGDVSVTKAKPEVVGGAVEAVRSANPQVRVLCGAGVKGGADVAKALELGAVGVLLASGVVKAKDPRAALRDLVAGL
jgi:triosephosphate isomerase